VHISCEEELQKIELYHANGKLMHSLEATGKEFTLETSHITEGIYFLQITTAQGTQSVKMLR
jgi:hypothetical protein